MHQGAYEMSGFAQLLSVKHSVLYPAYTIVVLLDFGFSLESFSMQLQQLKALSQRHR